MSGETAKTPNGVSRYDKLDIVGIEFNVNDRTLEMNSGASGSTGNAGDAFKGGNDSLVIKVGGEFNVNLINNNPFLQPAQIKLEGKDKEEIDIDKEEGPDKEETRN